MYVEEERGGREGEGEEGVWVVGEEGDERVWVVGGRGRGGGGRGCG